MLRGIEATLLNPKRHRPSPKDFLFARVNQGGARMETEKQIVSSAHCKLIIGRKDTAEYEDKVAQALSYNEFMPMTLLLTDRQAAEDAIKMFTLPFVSKSKTGSASCNVRLIQTVEHAKEEIKRAFGLGINVPHRLGEQKQRGYLLWQDFLSGNDYDYRVCKIGRYMMLLRRGNRDDVPFASGSGKTEPITELDRETNGVLGFAEDFFSWTGTKWCGIDVVRDHRNNKWRLLETTVGWKQSAYENCRFFGTDRFGGEIWELVCDELEAGVF